MKTICIARHGKSSWEDMSLDDYERPLLKKGINRTKKVGDFLAGKDLRPDFVISSHAKRAFQTAKILSQKLGYPTDQIQINKSLYFSGAKAIEDAICAIPRDKDFVMFVGHNPDMTNFVNQFLEEKVDYLPTSAIVGIQFKTNNWREIMMVDNEIAFVVYPKKL